MPEQKENNENNNPETQGFQEAVAREVAGLKANRDEILAELKKTREGLKAWEGLDPQEVRALLQQFSQDEDAKAIKEGRINDVIERRTKSAIERALNDKAAAEEARQRAEQEAQTYRHRYQTTLVANAVAAQVTGLAAGALLHVQKNVNEWFAVDENGAIIPTDKAPFWPKSEPLKLEQLKDFLLETSPFYFVPAAGGGAVKTTGVASKKRSEMTLAERAAFIRERGQEAYLQLPI